MAVEPPIKTWEERDAESEFDFPLRVYMMGEIADLRQRIEELQQRLSEPKPSPVRTDCDDRNCGDGYGCICYTR